MADHDNHGRFAATSPRLRPLGGRSSSREFAMVGNATASGLAHSSKPASR